MDEFISQILACEELPYVQPETSMSTPVDIGVIVNHQDIPVVNTIGEDPDIAILKQTYGEFNPGMVIKLDIASACQLLHKSRRRSDTFVKLQKKLMDEYGVALMIMSRKKQKRQAITKDN